MPYLRPLARLARGLSVAFLLAACAQDPAPTPPDEPRIPRALAWLPTGREHPVPALHVLDDDGDGTPDSAELALRRLVLDDGRRLERTLRYRRLMDGTFEPAITIDVRSLRAGEVEPRVHVETIPKSFAADVSALTFSREPTVIDPDPVVSWMLDEDETLRVTTAPAGASALASDALEVAADVAFEHCVQVAMTNEAEGELCLYGVVQRYPTSAAVARIRDACEDTICTAVVAGLASGSWSEACDSLPPDGRSECYASLFDIEVQQTCARAPEADRSACLLAALERVGDDEISGMLCYDTATQRLVDHAIDWRAFGTACASRADSSACESFDQVELRARCVGAYARLAMDPTLCNRIEDTWDYQLGDCLLDYFRAVEAPSSACEGFADPLARRTCFGLAALRERDVSLCERLGSAENANGCILRIVGEGHGSDPEACERIQREDGEDGADDARSKHDFCIMFVMQNTGDLTLCDRLLDANNRAWCDLGPALIQEDPGAACRALESPIVRCLCGALGALSFGDRTPAKGSLQRVWRRSASTASPTTRSPASTTWSKRVSPPAARWTQTAISTRRSSAA